MKENERRTPGSSSAADNKIKDSYEIAYEEQLKKFTELDYDTSSVPVVNVMGRDFEQHPARVQGSAQSRQGSRKHPSGKNGRKSAKSSGKRNGSGRQGTHIDRSEPLLFGMEKSGKGGAAVKEKKKGHPVKRFFTVLLIIILVLVLLLQLLIIRYLNKVTYRENGERYFTTASLRSDDVLNILVIGCDTRDAEERGRTDSMILLSIDKKNKRTTMTSFMRDSYVLLPDYDLDGDGSYFSDGDWCKLNAAYVYGGAELLLDTIEYNFDVAVDKYVFVNFFSFVDIVDSVGGIELDISDDEAEGMRAPTFEQNKILGKPEGTDYLDEGGTKMLVNGNQALAYARLRYVGNADFQRTERQRTVISKVIEKAKSLSIFGIDDFAVAVASNIETNMTKWELYKLIYRLPFIAGYDSRQLRIPGDDEYSYGTGWDRSSVLVVDFPSCIETINREIYEP